MRRTALYRTLRELAEGEAVPPEYVLMPQLMLQPPLESDVDARWPGLTPRERAKLAEDFEWECAHLQTFDMTTLYDAVARREREERSFDAMM